MSKPPSSNYKNQSSYQPKIFTNTQKAPHPDEFSFGNYQKPKPVSQNQYKSDSQKAMQQAQFAKPVKSAMPQNQYYQQPHPSNPHNQPKLQYKQGQYSQNQKIDPKAYKLHQELPQKPYQVSQQPYQPTRSLPNPHTQVVHVSNHQPQHLHTPPRGMNYVHSNGRPALEQDFPVVLAKYSLRGSYEAKEYDDDEYIDTKKNLSKATKEAFKDLDLNKLIKLRMQSKSSQFRTSSFVDQQFPVVASIQTDDLKTKCKSSTDLICVIDNSFSMEGEKLELVKKTFGSILRYLDENDRLSVIVFNSISERITPLIRMTPENKKKILKKISQIQSDGCTDISCAMKDAYEVLRQRRYVNSVSGIFLLSDGLDNNGLRDWNQIKLKHNFSIHSFGYGSDHDPELMTKIADVGDGNFYFIDKLDTVDEAFVDCLGSLISTVAQDVQVCLTAIQNPVLPGINIKRIHGDYSMWKKDKQGAFYTKANYLISGNRKDYVMVLQIPKTSNQLKDNERKIAVLNFRIKARNMEGRVFEIQKNLVLNFFNETEDFMSEPDNREVMKQYYRAVGGEVLDKARKLADQDQNTKAQKILRDLKEEIAHSVVKSDQFIKNLCNDIDMAINDLAPKQYSQGGRHNLIGNARAQMQQRGYTQSCNHQSHTNSVQQEMVKETQSIKQSLKIGSAPLGKY